MGFFFRAIASNLPPIEIRRQSSLNRRISHAGLGIEPVPHTVLKSGSLTLPDIAKDAPYLAYDLGISSRYVIRVGHGLFPARSYRRYRLDRGSPPKDRKWIRLPRDCVLHPVSNRAQIWPHEPLRDFPHGCLNANDSLN